ncbi:BON domain-containing protein [Niveibacterium sp. SC-1]|uniref:BON domain-containing protein n=1 Tax=Niveibacterium sp. SC-1 TaxID=3135646 RepID=UPI00311EC2D6
MKSLLAALLLSLALPACVPVIATGVGVGVAATVDRRSYGTQVEDSTIETRLSGHIQDTIGAASKISVTSYNRIVLLTGQVPTEADKTRATSLVSLPQHDIRGIYNELEVKPRASFSTQSQDTYVTSKVKARLLDIQGGIGARTKVVTETGTVFLMGLMTQQEADQVSSVTATTTGVTRVVRLFEIVSPETARQLDNAAPPAAASAAK